MTPVMIPGAGGQSPFITWGDIEGTPLRVTETFEPKGSHFKMQQSSTREKVASDLESKARKRKGSATPQVYHHPKSTPSAMPSFSSSSTPTIGGGRKKGPATPAAQLLAQRIAQQSSSQSDPFGGAASQLRQSYSRGKGGGMTTPSRGTSTPLVKPVMLAGQTPQPSPLVSRPVKKLKADDMNSSSSSSGKGGGGKKSLTDNLLV